MPRFVDDEERLGHVVDILAVSFGTWLGARRGLCSRFHPTFALAGPHVISHFALGRIPGERFSFLAKQRMLQNERSSSLV
jgi:hypothetical protein